MSRKPVALSLVILFTCSIISQATTWQTNAPGYWNNPGTWAGSIVPPYTSSDTFIIDHPVIFDQSLVFSPGADILINAAGGLCGHHNMTVHAGAGMIKYGILELDTMRIPGGNVLFKVPGQVIFTCYGIITNNGYLESAGCSFAVGPWFTCKLPEYSFQAATAVSALPQDMRFSITPNPNNGSFVLQGNLPGGAATFDIKDMTGRLVYREILKDNAVNDRQLRTALPAGFYYWQLKNNAGITDKGKLVIKE